MDGKQTLGVGSANEMTNSTSRKSPEKTPSLAESEATLPAHSASCNLDVPSALPFHAMFENSEAPLEYHGGEGRDFTIEEIVELGDDSLGLKVLLTAKQGPCLGVINIILTSCKKITLEKVCNPNTGKRMLGLRTFFFREVVNIKVLGEDQEARQRLLKDLYFEKQQGKKLLRKKLLPMHLQEACRSNMHTEVPPDLIQQLVCEEAAEDKPGSPAPPLPPGRLPRPSKWVIIDVIDEAYKKAISMICREMVIAVGFTGLKIGRSGTLVWVTFATSSMVFHFDMAKIGPAEAMKEGLGAVLQDGSVVKVVHDCRAIEDLLHHQLNINLKNVFDTQAAEIYLHLLNNKEAIPLLVPTLPSLLYKYLQLSPLHLFPDGMEDSKIDESLLLERPLAEPLGERLAREVAFLRELRLEQLDLMLVDLRQLTEVYLGVLRDKDSLTVKQLEPHIIPAEVQRLGKHRSVNTLEHGIPFTQHPKTFPKRGSNV